MPGDLVWLETPKNPTCEVADISAYVAAAAKLDAGDPDRARVVVDGTFAPPPVQRPLLLGADCVMHSATKYLAGHSDALCGALCVADEEVKAQLITDRVALGSTPGSLEVWLLLRSLRTLHVRVERQARSAGILTSWLHDAVHNNDHPLHGYIRAVWHPSLPSDPGHEIAKRQMAPGMYGGCFALELATEAAAKGLHTQLSLFRNATSLGGVESLIEWRRQYDDQISPYLLRVSVGLEDPGDLKEDLRRGILAMGKE
jgi:cystathionine gamma-synthase